MKPFFGLTKLVAVLILAGVFFVPSSSIFAAPNSVQKVRLQLKWRHQFQFAGYYAAVAKGYFKDEGLQVELLEGSPGIDPAAKLLTKEAEFAVDSPAILIKRQHGNPLVALAAIFQHSPSVMMTLKESRLDSPHDLSGKRVMMTPATDPAVPSAKFLTQPLNPSFFACSKVVCRKKTPCTRP